MPAKADNTSERDETTPRFHGSMMLALGAVLGMLAILIVASASAYTVDMIASAVSYSPSPVVSRTTTFRFDVVNAGSSSSQATVTALCIRDQSTSGVQPANCARSANGTDSSAKFHKIFTTTTESVPGNGGSRRVSFQWTPEPLTRGHAYDIAICADVYYTYGYTVSNVDNNCSWGWQGLTVEHIDLLGAHLSYGPGSAKETSSSTTLLGFNVTTTIWTMKFASTTRLHAYVENVGSIATGGSSTPTTFSSRFCIDNESCATSTSGRVGADIATTTALSVGPAKKKFVTSTANWTIPSDGKAHTLTFCPDVGDVIPESDESNCVTMNVYPVPAEVYNAETKTASPLGVNDNYGNASFGPLLGLISPYRPHCPGKPQRSKCL